MNIQKNKHNNIFKCNFDKTQNKYLHIHFTFVIIELLK